MLAFCKQIIGEKQIMQNVIKDDMLYNQNIWQLF